MNTNSKNETPPSRTAVFILSLGRSGSTWVSYVLGSHHDASFVGEYFRCFDGKSAPDCNYCSAKGMEQCQVLGSLSGISPDLAFSVAFDRTKKPLIIDCSKDKAWTDRFLSHDDFAKKIVFLIREPRGWYASQKKRYSWSVNEAMERWIKGNTLAKNYIEELSKNCGIEYITIFYDDLAEFPQKYFPPLFGFLGLEFQDKYLDYWNFEHHGPAGNGPAYNILGTMDGALVTTGDDKFYKANFHKQYYDQRWKQELLPEEIVAIESNPQIVSFLGELGRSW